MRHLAHAWPACAGLLLGGSAITTAWPAGAARHELVLSERLRWSNLRDISWRAMFRPDWPHGARGCGPAAILRGVLVAGVLDAPITDWALRRADDRLASIERALGEHDQIAVFADHGLSPCVSFHNLRGMSLAALISGATATGRPEWHVAPSGNLAHVYAHSLDARARLGRLGSTLVHDDAVGLVVHADIARGRDGWAELVSDAHSGPSPLTPYGSTPQLTRHLAKLARHPDAGDLIVMGAVDENGWVVAFERKRAAHGGLGGAQTEAFAVLPASQPASRGLDLATLREVLMDGTEMGGQSRG